MTLSRTNKTTNPKITEAATKAVQRGKKAATTGGTAKKAVQAYKIAVVLR